MGSLSKSEQRFNCTYEFLHEILDIKIQINAPASLHFYTRALPKRRASRAGRLHYPKQKIACPSPHQRTTLACFPLRRRRHFRNHDVHIRRRQPLASSGPIGGQPNCLKAIGSTIMCDQ